MGILRNPATGKNVILKAHHWFGKNADVAATCIQAADISQIHALARWDGQDWRFENYSAGETWVNHHRLDFGTGICPKLGDVIRFGALDPSIWVVLSLAPPQSHSAHPGRIRNSSAVFFTDPWPFSLAAPPDYLFEFHVSSDEEHVTVHIRYHDQAITLGERVHHYLLLTLARQRIVDAGQGQPPCNQGWLRPVRLSAMLNMDLTHVNVQVCRARKQMKAVLPFGGTTLIERRADGIRFGFASIIVMAGNRIEGKIIDGQPPESSHDLFQIKKGAKNQPLIQMI